MQNSGRNKNDWTAGGCNRRESSSSRGARVIAACETVRGSSPASAIQRSAIPAEAYVGKDEKCPGPSGEMATPVCC